VVVGAGSIAVVVGAGSIAVVVGAGSIAVVASGGVWTTVVLAVGRGAAREVVGAGTSTGGAVLLGANSETGVLAGRRSPEPISPDPSSVG
jgi:hypothetical protein